ncbi:MAG: hypothetical protein IT536_13835 [Hyphomicrobiales bacterium]|nr:hypothetical protein [Hyphomicrobiales bacterium]
MAFNGTGTHVRVHDWTTDLTNTIPVTASRMDAEHDDISTALSNCICRDGQSTTTARIPFASGLSAVAGSASAVAYALTNDANTGLYFPGTDQWGLAAGGTGTLTSTASKLTATVALDVSGTAAPASDDGAALGSTSQKWSDLFLAAGAVINFNNGDVTATHSANALAFVGATSGYSFDAAVTISSGGAAITGNSSIAGTLGVSGNVAVNTDKFTVAAASGNTAIAGTLAVTGATALANGLTVSAGTVSLPSASVALAALASTAKAFQAQLYHLRDERSDGTAGGTFTAGSWITRTLNTEVTAEIGGASLASNAVTLPAGSYFIVATAPTFAVGTHRLRLRNTSDGSDTLLGANASDGDLACCTTAHLAGRFTIAAQKTFELQHRCSNGQATEGLGRAATFGVAEVYADCMIWKVG